jgi:hypothetical protein
VSPLTDTEVSRALNALSMTLQEQRPDRLDPARAREIVLGALAHEPKLEVRATGPTSAELRRSDDGRLVATVRREDGRWVVERMLRAGESSWAVPQPAHAQQQRSV